LTDLGCKLVDKFCTYWPGLDGFNRGREYAERFSMPGRSAQLGHYAGPMLTPAFTDEVYTQSRKIFLS
jgi:hypothetical protein